MGRQLFSGARHLALSLSLVFVFSLNLMAAEGSQILQRPDSFRALSCVHLFASFENPQPLLKAHLDAVVAQDPSLQNLFGDDWQYTEHAFLSVLQKIKKRGFIRRMAGYFFAEDVATSLTEFERKLYALPLKDVFLLGQYIHYGSSQFFELLDDLAVLQGPIHLIMNKVDLVFARVILKHPAGAEERRMILAVAIQLKGLKFIDELMGLPRFEVEKLEQSEKEGVSSTSIPLSRIPDLGVGLGHNHWFSDYDTLSTVLNSILVSQSKHVVDLGSGTGRLGLLLGFLFPDIDYTGVEIHPARVQAAERTAERWGMKNTIFKEQDLLSSDPYPQGDYYYLYGPTNIRDLNKQIFTKIRATLENANSSAILVNSHWDGNALERELACWPQPFALLPSCRSPSGIRHYLLP